MHLPGMQSLHRWVQRRLSQKSHVSCIKMVHSSNPTQQMSSKFHCRSSRRTHQCQSTRSAFTPRAGPPSAQTSTSYGSNQDAPHSLTQQRIDVSLQDQVVYSKFIWPAVLKGNEVYIWGSFNNWERGVKLHRFDVGHDASVIMPLPPGNYEFKFVVDQAWTTAPHEATVTIMQGNTRSLNNFRVVAPSVTFSISAPRAQRVLVVGSWDDWQYSLLLRRSDEDGTFSTNAQLPPGQYSYYFIVDGAVTLKPDAPKVQDEERGSVHRVWSFEPSIFRIFYCTGWETTKLHYRRSINGKPLTEEWQEQMMVNAPSRGNALGVWKMASVVPTAADESLEFYLSNGLAHEKRKEDRPPVTHVSNNHGSSGGNGNGGGAPLYTCPFPGSFKLVRGMLRPFPRGSDSRILLVSDIDGTMIGDAAQPDAFDSSARFARYWEDSASLAGSLLAYNTGRSLGQFIELMQRCGGKVAVPDVIITAVGTKIWVLNEDGGRSAATGTKWVEDMAWTQSLDAGWDLDFMRNVANQLVKQYNDPGQLTILDDGREHRHRIAMSANASTVDHVTGTVAGKCREAGLEVRIIVSGAGSHRYVDCVSASSGKEKALQYVRQQAGIPEHLCVAAGDSGNDVLMLEGEHPSIVVGNAQPELLRWLVGQRQTGKVVYTDAFYADGILEGLARHCLY